MRRKIWWTAQPVLLLVLCMAATGWSLTMAADEVVLPDDGEGLNGRWELAETATEKKQRLDSIDRATRSVPGPMRERARGRILQRTALRQELILDVADSTLTLSSDGEHLALQIGGPAVQVKRPEGKAEVEASFEEGRLVVVSRAREATRTTRYVPIEDQLILRFSLQGSRLAQPVEFEATYVRATEIPADP